MGTRKSQWLKAKAAYKTAEESAFAGLSAEAADFCEAPNG